MKIGLGCCAVFIAIAPAIAGLTPVEYVQGNGTSARIVTDFVANPQTDKYVVEFALTQKDKTSAIWCSRGTTTTTGTWTLFWLNGGPFRYDYATSTDGNFGDASSVAVNTR